MDNYKLQHMDIDLSKPICRKNVGLVMGSGDEEANAFTVGVKRDGKEVTLTGCTVVGYLIMPNDETIRITGSVKDNNASVVVPKSGYVYDGAFTLTIKTGVSTQENTLAIFDGEIGRTTSGNIVDGNRVVYGVTDILNLIDSMEKAEADAKSATAAANNAAASANSAAQSANTIAQTVENKLDAGDFKGEKGDTGSTPNITFCVSTGEPGTQVQISQSGTAENPVVDLTIPRGDTGAVDGLDYFAGNPSALGTASPGAANGVARGDHVHPMPTAEQVGARAADWMPTAENVGALAVDGTAANSELLGGKLPSDYVTKDDNRTQIHLRWENGSLDSKFEASTVEIDLSDAIGVFINFIVSKGASTYVSSGFIPKISTNHAVFYFTSSGQRNARNARVTNSGVAFGASTTDGSTGSSDNIIPHRIYAVYRVVSTDVPLEDQ